MSFTHFLDDMDSEMKGIVDVDEEGDRDIDVNHMHGRNEKSFEELRVDDYCGLGLVKKTSQWLQPFLFES